jgi:ribosomal protein L10
MTLQDRLNTFENEARERIQKVLATSNEKLKELDQKLAKVAKEDLSVPRVKRELEGLRARADSLRASAIKRVGELPGEAVNLLVTQTRAPIQNLAKGLADIAKRLDVKPAEGEPKKNGTNGKGEQA